MTSEKWSIECNYTESCNCDFSCSCNFSGFPNTGRLRGAGRVSHQKGACSSVDLAGLDFVYTGSWPPAIHAGNGTMRVFISDRASAEQSRAIAEIAYGRAGAGGPSRSLPRR